MLSGLYRSDFDYQVGFDYQLAATAAMVIGMPVGVDYQVGFDGVLGSLNQVSSQPGEGARVYGRESYPEIKNAHERRNPT